jgi:hypothetical protein
MRDRLSVVLDLVVMAASPLMARTQARPDPRGAVDVVVATGHRAVGNSVTLMVDGSCLVAGYVEDEKGRSELVATTVSASGEVAPLLRFTGEASAWGWDAAPGADGARWIAGHATRTRGDDDVLLVRATAKSAVEWHRYFGGTGNDRCWATAVTVDGGVILAGETASFGGGERDAWLVRTDPRGEVVWQRPFGGAGTERLFGVVATANGVVLAVGGQQQVAGKEPMQALVIVVDKDGERLHERCWGNGVNTVAHGVAPAPDGTFWVAGYTRSPRGDHDVMITCLRADGTEVWQRVVPDEFESRAMTCHVHHDGTVGAIGYSRRDEQFEVFTLPFAGAGTPGAWRVQANPGDDRGVDLVHDASGG